MTTLYVVNSKDIKGGPIDFVGGGGFEENVPEQFIYFFRVRKQNFI